MPPVRRSPLVRLPPRTMPRALTELDKVTEEGSSSSVRALLQASTRSSTSSDSTRPSGGPHKKTRSLPNDMARRDNAALLRTGSRSGRVGRRSGRMDGSVRRAQTWTAPLAVSVASKPGADAPRLPPGPVQAGLDRPPPGPTSPSKPATPFNPFSSDSEPSSSGLVVGTPQVDRAASQGLRPPSSKAKPIKKKKVVTCAIDVKPFVPPEAGGEEDERQRQHASETERARTRLRLMLAREKAYRSGLLEPEVEGQAADAVPQCGMEPAEYQAQAARLFEVTIPRHADSALRDHLRICPDTRFLAVLLFARLVTVTVFAADEGTSPADAVRREISINQAAMGCLMIAVKTNNDFLAPLSPIGLHGFRWLTRREALSEEDLLHLEEATLQALAYRVNLPTPSHLLSELLNAIQTLLDAVLHLEPGIWEKTFQPACETSVRMLLLDFDHTRFPLSLLVCLVVWTDLREVMRDELESVEEAEDRASEVWAEIRRVVGGEDEWGQNMAREASRWIGKVLGW